MNKNPGRRQRRLAEREAKRKDGKRRSSFTEPHGKAVAVYRAGRVKEVER